MTDPWAVQHHTPARMVAFPASDPEWQLPEGSRHSLLCELLAHLLRLAAEPDDSVGLDQFVYFDASDAKRCLAPDAFLKRGVPFDLFESWKTWERGVPESPANDPSSRPY